MRALSLRRDRLKHYPQIVDWFCCLFSARMSSGTSCEQTSARRTSTASVAGEVGMPFDGVYRARIIAEVSMSLSPSPAAPSPVSSVPDDAPR